MEVLQCPPLESKVESEGQMRKRKRAGADDLPEPVAKTQTQTMLVDMYEV